MRGDQPGMRRVGRMVLAGALLLLAAQGHAFPKAGNDIRDRSSLQRGAANFMKYCSSCHSARFVRYGVMARDLGISDADLKANLMLTSTNPADFIVTPMTPEEGEQSFGVAPPDLSLMARARGTDYLAAFLRSFYADPTRPSGFNNTVMPGTAMPNVFMEVQGVQHAKLAKSAGSSSGAKRLVLESHGTMSPKEFEGFVRDTVNFMQYMGEPVELQRRELGMKVMAFLAVLAVLTYLLKREYWRNLN